LYEGRVFAAYLSFKLAVNPEYFDLSVAFNCCHAGTKDMFYKPDGTWAFPHGSAGFAVGFAVSRPDEHDPDGAVEILAQLSPILLPGDPRTPEAEQVIWKPPSKARNAEAAPS
jgi:hypothetical protein